VAATAPEGANVLRLVDGPTRFSARALGGDTVEFVYSGSARRLARDPRLFRFRYRVP
jgi:hypothetical protein